MINNINNSLNDREFDIFSYSSSAVVPKLLWICTRRVKVEVINYKTTWVRVKSAGGKRYISEKYKVSLKILEVLKKYLNTL
jgi:hypothetical protein